MLFKVACYVLFFCEILFLWYGPLITLANSRTIVTFESIKDYLSVDLIILRLVLILSLALEMDVIYSLIILCLQRVVRE